ncbi:MAG: porin [Pasteurella oralis]|uniref:porin n=1 Tax=Pasteurella oralis TaxID=1071947 RepID=UPI00270F79C4|nr:porin [Pasteurella oralis]
MKKTIVALAVAALAATSANAAVVYNQDGTKVEVGGSVRLLLQKETDNRTDLKDKGSRVSFKASHDLGSGLSALAYTELRFSDKNFGDSIHVKRLYAGFGYEGVGTLTFGKQLTIGDDIGLSDYTYNLGGVNKLVSAGDKVIHFKSADFNGFSFGADYVFAQDPAKYDTANKKNVNKNAYVLGALYNRKMGEFGFAVEAGYSQQKVAENVSNKAVTAGTEFSYGPFAVALDYSQVKSSNKAEQVKWRDGVMYNKVREFELGLKYQIVEASKVYADVIWGKAKDETSNVKLRGYIAGVDYKLHKQVVTYLEAGTFRYKEDGVTEKDNKVGVGLRVFF